MRTINSISKDSLSVSIDCPHCGRSQVIHATYSVIQFDIRSYEHEVSASRDRPDGMPNLQSPGIAMIVAKCGSSECRKSSVWSEWIDHKLHFVNFFPEPLNHRWIQPDYQMERPLPSSLPIAVREDHVAARRILPISPAASSTLLRRALEHYLRIRYNELSAGTRLADLIHDNLLHDPDASILASVRHIDAIRRGGNMGAHPFFSNSSGDLIEIEMQEVELMFTLVENLYQDLEIELPKSKSLMNTIEAKSKKA
jgi:hypothetical protein